MTENYQAKYRSITLIQR